DPGDGEEVVAMNGRYGPFIRKGSETRSLESEEQLFEVTLEQALQILAQPRPRRGRREPQPPLREMGTDPVSGRQIGLKEGRYGPYVTDGETNASIRGADTVESLELARALELLAERRAKGPSQPRRKRARR